MVLLQCFNLLLHKIDNTKLEIIGEDTGSSSQTPPSPDTSLAQCTQLLSHFAKLREMPVPVDGILDRLVSLDIAGCNNITRLPAAYGNNGCMRSLNISSTKISAIPASISQTLTALDVSSCRRVTNVGDIPNLVVLNCTNSAVVDINPVTLLSLRQLFAFHTKLSTISNAMQLEIMSWSPSLSGTLTIGNAPRLLSVLVTSGRDNVHLDGDSEAIVQMVGGT
mgnify:CR=1 FL=1